MEVKKIKITRPHGLHLRESANVVQIANKFKSKIYFCHKCKFADSCSILEMLSLAATKYSEVAVIAEGPDEKEAITNICEFFEKRDSTD